ncbi:MAG: glycosyltransferase family 4 protein [Bacteroidia bacterium]|nr:glycosyltransferase family 4 protein [Bacteroidia bacterium]
MSDRSIAIVANSTWNIYNFRLNIIRKLRDEGFKVTVIAPLDEYIEYKEQFPGVRHIPVNNLERDNTNPFKDLALMFELRRIYKAINPDLVLHYTHKPNIFGGFAAGISGLPSIAVVTGLGYAFIRKGWLNNLTRLLYKLAGRFHRKIVFENKEDLKYFLDKGLTNKSKVVSIKGCGVDTKNYFPVPNGIEKEKTIFTFIGRLLYDKGIVEFVEAAKLIRAKHPDTEFWVVGELDHGNPSMVEKEMLLDWIDRQYIIYHGFLRDVKPVIGKSDCIILPSFREGMPRIILEAMSMAKPVITTRTAGCRETVTEGENGYLVNVADIPDLVTAIERFLKLEKAERHKMGDYGREMAVREFNSEKIAEALFEIISLN